MPQKLIALMPDALSSEEKKLDFKIPPLPQTVHEVLGLIQEQDQPDIQRLISIIQKDPATASYILKRINSAYYGTRRNVAEIDRAVMMMGFTEICNLVLTRGLMQTFPYLDSKREAAVYEHIMLTSVAAGKFAAELSSELNLKLRSLAFTAGLLHQLGRLVLLHSFPAPYAALWYIDGSSLQTPSIDQEATVYSTSYAAIGAHVTEAWQMVDILTAIIQYHLQADHLEDDALRNLAHVIHISSRASIHIIEQEASSPFVETLGALLIPFAEAHGRSPNTLLNFLESTRDDVFQFASALQT